MDIYSIGFTQTTAERFFERLRESRVRRLLDVRRNPGSQLSGFAKGRDLPFFLRELVGAEYALSTSTSPSLHPLTRSWLRTREETRWRGANTKPPTFACLKNERSRRSYAARRSRPLPRCFAPRRLPITATVDWR